jgi:predicted RNase H-like HicB family nuclease
MRLTAVCIQEAEGYIAFLEELPGANTQGSTLDEARENLQQAVAWYWTRIASSPSGH